MDLSRNSVGCVLLGQGDRPAGGQHRDPHGPPADVPVGEAMLGRVVDALGQPWTEWGPSAPQTRPIEHEASGVISREPVNAPSDRDPGHRRHDPHWRGQRELLIGDRQTGKTAIAVDTILNQKGEDGSVSMWPLDRRRPRWPGCGIPSRGMEPWTTHHCVGHRQRPGPLQYIAPYSGAAMGSILCPRGRMCSSSMTI